MQDNNEINQQTSRASTDKLPVRSDEVDLVALTIKLILYWKSLAVSALVLVVIGVVAVSIFKKEVITMSSVIDIEPLLIGLTPIRFENPSSYALRFDSVILPALVKANKGNSLERLVAETKASNPNETNLITFENRLEYAQRDLFEAYHQQLLTEVLRDLKRSEDFAKKKVEAIIVENNNVIAELELNSKRLDREYTERAALIVSNSESAEVMLDSLDSEVRFKKAEHRQANRAVDGVQYSA